MTEGMPSLPSGSREAERCSTTRGLRASVQSHLARRHRTTGRRLDRQSAPATRNRGACGDGSPQIFLIALLPAPVSAVGRARSQGRNATGRASREPSRVAGAATAGSSVGTVP